MQLSHMLLQIFLGLEGRLALLASEELCRPLVLLHVFLQILLGGEAEATILTLELLATHSLIRYLPMDGGI